MSGSQYDTNQMGEVYFVQCNDFLKIGYSTNVKSRLAKLQTGNPYELKPLVIVPGTAAHEKRIHGRFHKLRTRGEWFELNEQMLCFLTVLKNCKHLSELYG